ncbi:MAG: proprotein convertase P-domain-containing protein [Planctomycetota bacterium]
MKRERYLFAAAFFAGALLPFTAVAQPVAEQCSTPALPISGTLPPVQDFVAIADDISIVDLNVLVRISHTFVGDLEIDLESPALTSIRLHDGAGGTDDDIDAIYNDLGVTNGSLPYDCGCWMQPSGPGALADYAGESSEGIWTLTVVDTFAGDDGTLDEWCVRVFDSIAPPGVSFLSCSDTPSGIIEATWSNPITFDEINIYLDGVLAATLGGSETTFSSNPFPVPSVHELCVEAVLGGVNGGRACCTAVLGANPNYVFSLTDATGFSGDTVTSQVLLQNSGEPIQGWSFSVCHDSSLVTPIAAVEGATTTTVNGGGPPDFVWIDTLPEGVVMMILVNLVMLNTLDPGPTPYEILDISYTLIGPTASRRPSRSAPSAIPPSSRSSPSGASRWSPPWSMGASVSAGPACPPWTSSCAATPMRMEARTSATRSTCSALSSSPAPRSPPAPTPGM